MKRMPEHSELPPMYFFPYDSGFISHGIHNGRTSHQLATTLGN